MPNAVEDEGMGFPKMNLPWHGGRAAVTPENRRLMEGRGLQDASNSVGSKEMEAGGTLTILSVSGRQNVEVCG